MATITRNAVGTQGFVSLQSGHRERVLVQDYTPDSTNSIAYLYGIPLLDGMPQRGAVNPENGNLILQSYEINPLGAGNWECFLNWQTPLFGGPSSAFIIEYSSVIQPGFTEFLPGGTRFPLRVDFVGKTPHGYDLEIPEDIARFQYMRMVRRVSITQLIYGEPPTSGNDKSQYVDYVNQGTWLGRSQGSWLMEAYTTTISRYSGYYTVRASALAKRGEDWREPNIMRRRQTGLPAPIDEDILARDMNTTYFNSAPSYTRANGYSILYPYPVTPFQNIFGF